ncbi:DUF1811 family protein [Effusibacillus lacus]|uniref:DUF1811 domain-containing protein n=1 Tax=Effusibacillus lacus TaxID=1348429 RepID=A0A292YMV3_9BACL|nr:DUF1811 family protein [Effusibacillus lacus]TCS72299.1 uncharacterized protein DUF1811 [Effusibacillus lacus]GAX90229.1 hypothetical protein EFBL_1855 [Effusibacillus lacus]
MKPDKLLSEMSPEELKLEMERLKQRGLELFEAGDYEEAMVLRTRWYLAASYLMDPKTIEVGGEYFIEGEPGGVFAVSHLDGVMAHGTLSNKPGVPLAYPIAMLTKEPPVE